MALIKRNTISFGERLRSLREERGIPLRLVAEKIGMDTSLLGKIERNERQATKEQIKLIAKYFKYDEQLLIEENLSDQIAYRILDENVDLNVLKVAEGKVKYFKKSLYEK